MVIWKEILQSLEGYFVKKKRKNEGEGRKFYLRPVEALNFSRNNREQPMKMNQFSSFSVTVARQVGHAIV